MNKTVILLLVVDKNVLLGETLIKCAAHGILTMHQQLSSVVETAELSPVRIW